MTVLTIFIFIYILCGIIAFSYTFVELTLDSVGIANMICGTLISLMAGICWPIVLIMEVFSL